MSFRLRTAGTLFVKLALGGLAVAGCKSNKTADADTLPPEVQAAMDRGDDLITEGESLVEEGKKKGPDGAEMIKQGEAKIAEGNKMKATAAATLKK
jgi:hypothetical protein